MNFAGNALGFLKKFGEGLGNFIFGSIPDEFDQYDKLDLQEMASGSLKCKNQLWS